MVLVVYTILTSCVPGSARASWDHPANTVSGHLQAVWRLLNNAGVQFPLMFNIHSVLTEDAIVRMSARLTEEARRVRIVPAGGEYDRPRPAAAGQSHAPPTAMEVERDVTSEFLNSLNPRFRIPPNLRTMDEIRAAYNQWLMDQYEDSRGVSPPPEDRGFVQHEDFELAPESSDEEDRGPPQRPHEGGGGQSQRPAPPSPRRTAGQATGAAGDEEPRVVEERRAASAPRDPRRRPVPPPSVPAPSVVSQNPSRDGAGTSSGWHLPNLSVVPLYIHHRFPEGPTVANQLVLLSGAPDPAEDSRPRCPELLLLQGPPGFASHSIDTVPGGPPGHGCTKNILLVSLGELSATAFSTSYRNFRRFEFVNGQLTEVGRSAMFYWGGYIWGPDTNVVHLDFANGHLFFGPQATRVTARQILVILEGMGWYMGQKWDCIYVFGARNDCRWLCRATEAELRALLPGLPAGQPVTVTGIRRLLDERMTAFEVSLLLSPGARIDSSNTNAYRYAPNPY
jgi:hypothetical protein